MPSYLELEVSLKGIKPRIWRRFLIRDSGTFADLHQAIQDAFGWESAHLWEFRAPGRRGEVIAGLPADREWEESADVPDAQQVRLADYFGGSERCLYVYDFGDSWEHEVKLRKALTTEEVFFRRLLDGRRAGPPEDCGGVWGYDMCVAVARGEEDDPEHAAWLGEWDPEGFDLKAQKSRFDQEEAPDVEAGGGRAPRVVEEIFTCPPEDEAELDRRLAGLPPDAVREALVERLCAGQIPLVFSGLSMAVFDRVGLGGCARRLADFVLGQPEHAQAAAILQVLGALAPAEADRVMDQAPEDVADALQLEQFRLLTLQALSQPEGGSLIAEMLAESHTAQRLETLRMLEALRHLDRVPALLLYGEAIRHPDLGELRKVLLETLVSEPSLVVTAWLEDLAREPSHARLAKAALADLAAGREIAPLLRLPERPPLEARCLVSSCDGEGIFYLLFTVDGGRERQMVSLLEVDVLGGMLSDDLLFDQTDDLLQEMLGELAHEHMCNITSVEVEEGVTLAQDAWRLAREDGLDWAEDGYAGITVALSLGDAAPLEIPEPIRGALTEATCKALLERPEYATWFFDREALAESGVRPPPRRGKQRDAWVEEAARALDTPALRRQLGAMLRHMAYFHSQFEEPEEAELCAAAAARVDAAGLGGHPLVEAMLRQSAE